MIYLAHGLELYRVVQWIDEWGRKYTPGSVNWYTYWEQITPDRSILRAHIDKDIYLERQIESKGDEGAAFLFDTFEFTEKIVNASVLGNEPIVVSLSNSMVNFGIGRNNSISRLSGNITVSTYCGSHTDFQYQSYEEVSPVATVPNRLLGDMISILNSFSSLRSEKDLRVVYLEVKNNMLYLTATDRSGGYSYMRIKESITGQDTEAGCFIRGRHLGLIGDLVFKDLQILLGSDFILFRDDASLVKVPQVKVESGTYVKLASELLDSDQVQIVGRCQVQFSDLERAVYLVEPTKKDTRKSVRFMLSEGELELSRSGDQRRSDRAYLDLLHQEGDFTEIHVSYIYLTSLINGLRTYMRSLFRKSSHIDLYQVEYLGHRHLRIDLGAVEVFITAQRT